ncbi:MAG: MFS transporter [Acidimicrobiia bacterium]
MHTPIRLLYAVRPQASTGVLGAAATVSALFVATPFIIPEVADRYGVPLGAAGLISTAQVGGFAATSFLAGRLLRPSSRILVLSLLILATVNGLSALSDRLWQLSSLRASAGAAAGVVTWLAWADATRFRRGLGDVAAAGPLAAVFAAPLFGWATAVGDDRAVYLTLAVLALIPLGLPVRLEDLEPVGRTVSSSSSNRVLLATLFLLTTAGSSIFVYAAAAGRDLAGLGPMAVSVAFSLNALAGILATRITPGRIGAGVWLAGTAVGALIMGTTVSPTAYFAAMIGWGFVFWVGVPEVFRLLAARSASPGERVGDAQALMALGRALGPAVGGLLVGEARYELLAFGASAGLFTAAMMVSAVEVRRRAVADRLAGTS